MGKVYAMGDTHGDWWIMHCLCENMTEDDIVIHVGDHGVNYSGEDEKDNFLKKKMSKMKPTFILIRGNHDRKCPSWYKTIERNDIIKGTFLIDEQYPNILHCEDINFFRISNVSFLTISGAYSVDKDYRILNGWNWFEDEQISPEKMELFKRDYKGMHADVIISHTAPVKYEPTHLFLPFIDQSKVDKRTEIFLDWVEENIDYCKWFLGHYHENEQLWDKGYMLFQHVKEIMEI